MKIISLRLVVLVAFSLAGSAHAQHLTFLNPSQTPSASAATRTAWLASVGITSPQFTEDFETGYVDGQNIHDTLITSGVGISDTGSGTPAVLIEGTPGGIGGSNPVGAFSAEHDQAAFLVLDFSAAPVDYLGLLEIDTGGTTYRVTFEGGGFTTFVSNSTLASGDSAQFVGMFRNDRPAIVKVEMDATGTQEWAIDNIEFGVVPEPSTAVLAGAAFVALLSRRSRKS